jgi:hypothetical protein
MRQAYAHHAVLVLDQGTDAGAPAGDWQVVDAGCTRIEPADRAHARRLLKSG